MTQRRCCLRLRRVRPDSRAGERARASTGDGLDASACSPSDGGWGAFDADNTRELALQAAVLRLRRGHRPAVGGRHRPRRRAARRRRAGRAPRHAAAGSSGCCASRRPTDRGSAGGAAITSTGSARSFRRWSRRGCRRRRRRSGGPGVAGRTIRTPTVVGARTCAPTTIAPGPGAGSRRHPRRRGRCWRCLPPRATGPSIERGIGWLVARQDTESGTWDEPQFTGTGFPGDFYINYHLYRHGLPGVGARALLPASLARWGVAMTAEHRRGGLTVLDPAACRARRGARARCRMPTIRAHRHGRARAPPARSQRRRPAGPVAVLGVAGGIAPEVAAR